MRSVIFSPSARAAEKQRARDEDERALRTGEKTREQLTRENGLLSRVRVRLSSARSVL